MMSSIRQNNNFLPEVMESMINGKRARKSQRENAITAGSIATDIHLSVPQNVKKIIENIFLNFNRKL